MLRIASLFLIALVSACEPNGLYSVQDGEAFLEGIVRLGSTKQDVEVVLAKNNVGFSEIPADDCGDVGDMWMDPRCICAGSPALWLQLSDNARPGNPFYSPTMSAFIVFNEQGLLTSMAVIILGGDE